MQKDKKFFTAHYLNTLLDDQISAKESQFYLLILISSI